MRLFQTNFSIRFPRSILLLALLITAFVGLNLFQSAFSN